MKDFKIKCKNGEKELELEIGHVENPEEFTLLKSILSSFDINIEIPSKTTPSEEDIVEIDDEKDDVVTDNEKDTKIQELKEGYNIFSNEIIGLHHPESEYELQSSSMLEAFRKAEEASQTNVEIEVEKETKKYNNIQMYNNVPHYQTYYVCPKCSNRGKRFLSRDTLYCHCHNCPHKMRIKNATKKGFPNEDSYGNIFIAGSFKMVEEREMELADSMNEVI